eukprot:1050747-Amphidinium_carterae.3
MDSVCKKVSQLLCRQAICKSCCIFMCCALMHYVLSEQCGKLSFGSPCQLEWVPNFVCGADTFPLLGRFEDEDLLVLSCVFLCNDRIACPLLCSPLIAMSKKERLERHSSKMVYATASIPSGIVGEWVAFLIDSNTTSL